MDTSASLVPTNLPPAAPPASPLRHAAALSAFAFVVHFAWETLQCPLFFVHGSYDATWGAMLAASLGDVGLTWVIYAAVAIASRRWRWAGYAWSWPQILTLVATALSLGIGIELRALSTERWQYSDAMPMVPLIDVGLIPLLQLLVLTPLIVAVVGRFSAGRTEPSETAETRERYDRIAPLYDALEWMMELRFRGWRRELWSRVDGRRILVLGVGTGKNLRWYPDDRDITAIDISENMLRRARSKATRLGVGARLELADAQALPFGDGTFDVVVATFVFCSVPDPVQGLREALRVLRPGGRLILLEHVLSEIPVVRPVMRLLDPIPAHIWGAHVDRETVQNVRDAGFIDIDVRDVSLDIVKLIEADKR